MSNGRIKLEDFDISETSGFMPADPPLERLPADRFTPWEDLMKDLPSLVREKRIREKILQLPPTEFNDKTLLTEAEWQRAYVVLCYLSQSYIWMEGEAGLPHKVPKLLAVPWCAVSDHLGLPAVMTYSALVTYNYRLHDPDGPFDGDNVFSPATFTGTGDEVWFYVIPMLVEYDGLPGLKAMVGIFSSMVDDDKEALGSHIGTICTSLKNMVRTLKRQGERADPKVTYTQVRPFISGSKGLDAFPDGLIYEGVDPKPRQYNGASAGQSSMLHAYDIFFHTKHEGSSEEYLKTMRAYMPPKHRKFLEVLGQQPSLREYICKTRDPELVQRFNAAIKAFVDFRSQHIILVTRFILQQKAHSSNPSLNDKGTGGTPFMHFLKQVRDNTKALEITLK